MSSLRFSLSAVIAVASALLALAQPRTLPQQLQEGITLMETRGDYRAAIAVFESIAKGTDRALAARALLYLGRCYERLGRSEAQGAYERVIQNFADQRDAVAEARALLSRLRGGGGPRVMTVRKAAFQPRFGPNTVPSSDGRYFSDIDPHTGNLVLVDTVAHQTRRIAPANPEQDEDANLGSAVSPDATHVAYGWWTREQRYDVRVVSARGGTPRVLMSMPKGDAPEGIVWARDGTRILVVVKHADFTSEIATVSVRDGATRVLKSFAAAAVAKIDVSPDGRFLVYDGPGTGGGADLDVFILRTDTLEERPLVRHPAVDRDPLWTPDGSAVVFVSNRAGTNGAWLQRVKDGTAQGAPEMLNRDLGRASLLSITRAGVLFYGLQTGLVDVYTADFDAAALHVASPTPVSPNAIGSNNTCAWSPDGSSLVYVESLAWSSSRNSRLAVRDLRTGAVREVAPAMNGFLNPRWSPDGKAVLVKGYDNSARYGIYRIDLDLGGITPVATAPPSDESDLGGYQWARDGRAVLYARNFRLLSHDLTTGAESRVLDPAPLKLGPFQYAPDGRTLAFSAWVQEANRRAQTMIIAVKEGDSPIRELVRTYPPEAIGLQEWTEDGAGILYTKQTITPAGDNSELWYVAASGGAPRSTGFSMRGLRGVHLSPDGRRLAFTAGWPDWQLWTMENFLPARTVSASAPRRGRE